MTNHPGQVIFTRDWHPKGHVSFGDSPKFPEHCVQGSGGALIITELEEAANKRATTTKNPPAVVFFKAVCANGLILLVAVHTQMDIFTKRHPEGGLNCTGVRANENITQLTKQLKATGGYRVKHNSGYYYTFEAEMDAQDTKLLNDYCGRLQRGIDMLNVPNDKLQSFDDYIERLPFQEEFEEEYKPTSYAVCGLALDFCVLDTAINIRQRYPSATVYILLNLTRGVFVRESGTMQRLTSAQEIAARINTYGIKVMQITE